MIKGIIFDWIGTLYQRNVGLFPEAEEVIERLSKQYRLSLISLTSNVYERGKEIKETSIAKHFIPLVICRSKTPEEYQLCMTKMKTTPETTLVVDDRTVRGIQIGNQLGMKTCWIQAGEYAHETPTKETGQPTYTIKRLSELENLEFFRN